MKRHRRCRIGGSFGNGEIPLLLSFLYLFGEATVERKRSLSGVKTTLSGEVDSCRRHCQVGSLAGAAHLSNDNAGVLRRAQRERKSRVEQKGKSSLDFDFQYEYKLRKHGLSIL